MELIADFKKKYPRYWSVWLNVGAALLSILELLGNFGTILPSLQDSVPPGTFVALSIAFTLAGLVARAIKQSSLNPEPEEESRA